MTILLSLLCFLSLLSNPSSSQQTEFSYTSFNQMKQNIILSESAEILKNGILQLTTETNFSMGHAFYTSPIQFKNSPNSSVFSFSTCFAIVIVPTSNITRADGLAFALSPTSDLDSADSSGFLGLFNGSNDGLNDDGNPSNPIFAVEFDTFQNHEYNDANDNHIGIDINSLVSNDSAAAAYYTADVMRKQKLNLANGEPILVWIDYDSVTTLINVTISPFDKKPSSPIISYKYDLSTLLKERMYIGFSASTGVVTSLHYVLGWSFKMNGVANSLSLKSLPSLLAHGPRKKKTALIVGVSGSSIVFLVAAILSGIYLTWKIKNRDVIEDWEHQIGPHRYPYQELKRATKDFKDSELLGAGGFGRVYKGTLPNSKAQIAVKQISSNSRQGLREFVSEIVSIGKLRHRNLVQLLGWCRRQDDLLLVYDFMPNGSLDKFFYNNKEMVLNWQQRFNIIKGVASALLYIHEEYEQVVIHRDIKASNVLLDSELNGRLGDFGLAKLYEHGANPKTTRIVGTIGYLAPEFSKTGKACTKSDVYSFGTLLFEVVCGRRPIEHKAAPEEMVLVDWVRDKWKEGSLVGGVDPRLKGEFDEFEAMMVLKLGLMCSNDVPDVRPSMRQVVRHLDGVVPLPDDLIPLLEGSGEASDVNASCGSISPFTTREAR